jgi:hypothetical protein
MNDGHAIYWRKQTAEIAVRREREREGQSRVENGIPERHCLKYTELKLLVLLMD